jgi:acetoin utilization deacetylase AcuC-like enzyme
VYISLHADPDRAFPYFTGRQAETGIGRGAGTTMNFVLPEGCDDERYLGVLAEALDIAAASGPVGLVISLGLDTFERDPICDLKLTTAGCWRIGSLVRQLAVPAVVVQEGGYYVPDLGINARTWLRGFLGLDRGPSPADGASQPVGPDNAAQIPDRHL